jgi:hypothetical protein
VTADGGQFGKPSALSKIRALSNSVKKIRRKARFMIGPFPILTASPLPLCLVMFELPLTDGRDDNAGIGSNPHKLFPLGDYHEING